MNCLRTPLPGGGLAIVCTSRRHGRTRYLCRWCPHTGELQCDWKVASGKTCDKYICAAHAFQVGPEKHLCPEHQVAYQLWLRELGIAY